LKPGGENSIEKNIMQVSVDQKIYAPLVLCFAVACALAFLLISTTAQAGHDNGDNQCISDVKVIDLGGENAQTFAVNGQSPTVGFQDHIIYYTKENEVILQVDTTPTATVKVPESDIGDGGSDKGNWNSISNSTLEVRIRDASRDGSDITSIYVDVHDTDCGDDNTSGNNPPTADDEGTLSLSICTNDNLDINVLEGDKDPDGDSLQVIGLSQGTSTDNFASTTVTGSENGTAAIINGGDGDYQVRYTPDSEYSGKDSFQYKVSDGNGGTDTAMVYLDVQGEDGGCGDIRVSFDYTNDEGSSGGTADPTYDHASTSNLSPKTTASSGDELVWNVPLEVATNTAKLIDDYIDPPEGYQLKNSFKNIVKSETETGEDFTGENTTAWLGKDYDGQSTTTCSTTVAASDWSGEPTSYSYAKDGNGYYEETSDGKATATLDITNYVGSDDSLNSVSVGYTGIAECDTDAESCSASATTTVTFSNGSSTSRSASADTDTASREYEGLYETLDSSVTSAKVVNDSSASITRDSSYNSPAVEASATGTLQATDIYWETTESCS